MHLTHFIVYTLAIGPNGAALNQSSLSETIKFILLQTGFLFIHCIYEEIKKELRKV
jgi:hypothetical protein